MKIRLDFVTNSSSTSSAVALGSALLGVLTGLGMTSCQCTNPGGGSGNSGGGGSEQDPTLNDAALDAALEASKQAGQDAADNMAADANAKDQLIKTVLDGEQQKLNATALKLQDEIAKYKQQWTDAQQGADPKAPGYDKLKKQYDDYIDYVKGQLDQVKAKQYEIEVTKAQEAAAQESKNEWVKQRQQDLVQVKEQKSFLEAVSRGYGKDKNYDITKVQQQINDLKLREQEIGKTLKENNAEINYTARERGEIGPDPEMARINNEYKQKKQQLQQQMNDRKAMEDKQKRTELDNKMKWLNKDMETQASRASFWNVMTKAAETTQVVSDVSIDVLSNVTGPYGKTIKTCYTGLKGLGGGLGEGMANGDMSKNIVKGGLGGLSDIAKDKIGDKFGKSAQQIYTIGSEAGKSMVEAGLDGKTSAKDMVKAGLTGAAKGSLDAAVSVISDNVLPSGSEMPKGLDWSDINVKTFVNTVKSSNPLTVRNIGREAIGNGIQSAGVDQVKNGIKGDNLIFSGFKQNVTDDIIDKGTSLGATKYTPTLVNGINKIGDTMKNTGNLLGNMVKSGSGMPNVKI